MLPGKNRIVGGVVLDLEHAACELLLSFAELFHKVCGDVSGQLEGKVALLLTLCDALN